MDEAKVFRDAYEHLSLTGACDGYGGAESRRVYQEWIEANEPLDVERFIRDRANIGPIAPTPVSG